MHSLIQDTSVDQMPAKQRQNKKYPKSLWLQKWEDAYPDSMIYYFLKVFCNHTDENPNYLHTVMALQRPIPYSQRADSDYCQRPALF